MVPAGGPKIGHTDHDGVGEGVEGLEVRKGVRERDWRRNGEGEKEEEEGEEGRFVAHCFPCLVFLCGWESFAKTGKKTSRKERKQETWEVK